MTFDEWIVIGMESEFCGPPVCSTHDGLPTSRGEDDELEDGYDPCMSIVRLYEDADVKRAVEENHSPSVWRRTNRGG